MTGPTYTQTNLSDGWVRIKVTPPAWAKVGDGTSIDLTAGQFERFQEWKRTGRKIQDILPDLTDDQREVLLSGISPEKWTELFPKDD